MRMWSFYGFCLNVTYIARSRYIRRFLTSDILHTDQDIDGQALLDMIEDMSEFKEVLPKAGDRMAVKRVVERLQKAEKVFLRLRDIVFQERIKRTA